MDINLGLKIRELRRARGLTQDDLAKKLSISPQAVSKWERNDTYPDMMQIPVIANIFGVSLDTLFGYDAKQIAEKVGKIIADANGYFWDKPEIFEEKMLTALGEFPGNERLLSRLISLYECHARSYGKTEYIDKAIPLANELIAEGNDTFAVCSAKADLASLHILRGDYSEAKAIINSLPTMYPYMLNDKMRVSSYQLKGSDRLENAKEWKTIEIQELYIACEMEGKGYFEIGKYEDALKSFDQYRAIIEMFMKSDEINMNSYLWGGMQTHHWNAYICEAGCLLKLGRTDEYREKLERAYYIISHAWGDEFDKEKDYFMKPFRMAYEEMGLDSLEECKW